jgi:large subunit ribosomal protein L18
LSSTYAQVIDDQTGHTLVSASTIDKELRSKMKGLTKTEQAKEVGLAVADRAKKQGIENIVFDRGGYRYVGRVKALAEGAREGGLQF